MAQGEMFTDAEAGVRTKSVTITAEPERLPLGPDRDGLFDIADVDDVCRLRYCYAGRCAHASDLFVMVKSNTRSYMPEVRLTAIAPGKFDPVSILKACTEARGDRLYDIDYSFRAENPGGLDEVAIARVLGADGIMPYRSKACADRTTALSWTLALSDHPSGSSHYNVRAAVLALQIAGFLGVVLGPRRGMGANATFTWSSRAYLPVRLSADDNDAIGELA